MLNEHVTLDSVTDGKNMMKERMCRKKVLLVLDDVDHIEQLKALAGEPKWFKPGSRILITTRDEQVLVAHRVSVIRDVALLSEQEGISLFSRYAFGRENPLQGFEELSGKVVRYAAGLPLTVEVLGSFLCGKDMVEWEDAIERLKTIPLKETLKQLELSYISLEDDYKEIFLDIACILKGQTKEDAIGILESCGFHARNGLKVLEQRFLITISEFEHLGMHDHIEEMGKNIVRRSHPDEPNKHSRVWIEDEIEDILANDMSTEETSCLKLNKSTVKAIILMKGFGKMKKLRCLEVNFASYYQKTSDVEFLDDTRQYFPNSLKYIKCLDYPFSYLPETFQANNLVGVEIYWSRIVQLGKDGEKKVLKKLKFLFLYNCSRLTTFNFRMTPNLETLSLINSFNLKELCMPVTCQKLKQISIFFELRKQISIRKSKLKTFDLELSPNLETLYLSGCADFEELCMPVSCQKLNYLWISHSKLRTFGLGLTPNLETLSLERSGKLEELCMPVRGCQKLKHLNISHSKLRTFDLGLTPNLETLSLSGCADFEELCMPVSCQKLNYLCISHSKLRTFDLGLTPNLETFSLSGCADFEELHVSVACPNLKFLDLSLSGLRSLDLELIPNLEELSLDDCNELEEINAPAGCMKKVVHLTLSGCALLEKLPKDIG